MDRMASMETFIRVVETGSFSGAARQLRVGQPAVSKTVAQLESPTQTVRRELIRKVIATDPVIDEVKGESSTLRYHSPALQQAVDAMFAVLAAWRTVDARLR